LPRSLFLKIFLWFSSIVLTVILFTFLGGELMRHERTLHRERRPLDAAVDVYAKAAAEQYERGGQAALTNYLDGVQHQTGVRSFLFNSQVQELSGRRMPAEAPDIARRVFETQSSQLVERGRAPLLGRIALGPSGDQYVLIAELPPPQSGWIFHPSVHLLAAFVLGGLVCYGLARYLTSPVAKLRAATRELAAGNLSVRVSPGLGGRRDELASLAADFDEMAEKIQLLIESQRRLLGDISHELRSPLARLNVALELARQRSGEAAQTALERIQLEAETLNEMIGQLLTLTRIESGAEAIPKTKFDLQPLVMDVVNDADFEARARDRAVRLGSSASAEIDGVASLVRGAIENVVRNAVDYTAKGTTVAIDLTSGVSVAGLPGRCAVIVVRDHGPGVPEESLTKIFRPFYRVDEARAREAGGVGLGLAIAERAVKLHGGTIAATNAEGGGLIVTISLPAEEANSK
jgi:two-component system sensor histidine kinase CpxA